MALPTREGHKEIRSESCDATRWPCHASGWHQGAAAIPRPVRGRDGACAEAFREGEPGDPQPPPHPLRGPTCLLVKGTGVTGGAQSWAPVFVENNATTAKDPAKGRFPDPLQDEGESLVLCGHRAAPHPALLGRGDTQPEPGSTGPAFAPSQDAASRGSPPSPFLGCLKGSCGPGDSVCPARHFQVGRPVSGFAAASPPAREASGRRDPRGLSRAGRLHCFPPSGARGWGRSGRSLGKRTPCGCSGVGARASPHSAGARGQQGALPPHTRGRLLTYGRMRPNVQPGASALRRQYQTTAGLLPKRPALTVGLTQPPEGGLPWDQGESPRAQRM